MMENSEFIIGDNFTMSSGDGMNPLTGIQRARVLLEKGARVIIGNNTGMSSTCIWAKTSITIGNNVLVGGGGYFS